MLLKLFPAVILVMCYVFLVTSFNYYFLAITIILTAVFICYQLKFYYKYLIFLCLLLLMLLIYFWQFQDFNIIECDQEADRMFQVLEKHQNYYVLRYQKHNFLLWKSSGLKINLRIDDQIKLKTIIVLSGDINLTQDFFSYPSFVAKGIIGYLKIVNFDYEYFPAVTLRNVIFDWLEKYDKHHLLTFFYLQDYHNNFDDLLVIVGQLGVSHLLVISGFHLLLQVKLLNFILKKIFKQQYYQNFIIFSYLIFYLYLLNWQLSTMRAFLYWFFRKINEFLGFPFAQLDLLAFICCLFLIFNPLVIYQTSFQLSFLCSFLIIYYNYYFKFSYKIVTSFCLQIFMMIILLPINIFWQNHLNLLYLFHQLIFTLMITIFYYIFLIFIWIEPWTNIVFNTYRMFLFISQFLMKWTYFYHLVVIPVWFYFCYYFLVISLWYGYKNYYFGFLTSMVYFSLWCFWISVPFLNSNLEIHMINVGNGLSILINLPYNQGNILYDVGTEYFNRKNSVIVNYLKQRGINTIDVIFLSHQHQDHINNLSLIQEKFKVHKVYNNKVMQERYLINNIVFYNLAFSYIQQVKMSTENNQSLVLFWKYQNFQILFTGDLEKFGEKQLMLFNQRIINIDFLQIAHHGSNSSSTIEFLEWVQPKRCFISARKTFKKNLPHPSVLSRLQQVNCQVYWTGKHNNIVYQINNQKDGIYFQ